MLARNPRIEFAEALPRWCANHAFAQINNATSTGLVPIETYLNKVVTKVASASVDARLKRDVQLFCAQEGNHYRQHNLFNKALYVHYPEAKAFERQLQADYDRFLVEKPLIWNAAYCEGFESLGIIYTKFFFEDADDLLDGADARLVRLWKWHLAEEFEHRTVAYDVLKAAGGGYAWRLRGLHAALTHLTAHSRRVADHLLTVDRAGMSADERAKSVAEEAAFRKRRARAGLPQMVKLLSPFYDPRRKAPPRGSEAYLAELGT